MTPTPPGPGGPSPRSLNDRASGILLHLISLPGKHGCGDLGPQAHRFASFLAEAGQRWWQVLPIHTTNLESSPYNAITAFAGSPFLISLEALAEEGLLSAEDVAPALDGDGVDYARVWGFKLPLFWKAFDAFERRKDPASREPFEAFCRAEAGWLDDYALFAALRESHQQRAWTDWEPELRRREPRALEAARGKLAREMGFQKFLQHVFWTQWERLQRRCEDLGVGMMGDVAFFVAHDSADVWAHPRLFSLNGEGYPALMAGVPPDYFSATGQLWGNPLYEWEPHRAEQFAWWTSRLTSTLRRFDSARLDHFMGFYQCWAVPGGSSTAEHGRYIPSPGGDILSRVQAKAGGSRLVAEDLAASVPEGLVALRERFGLPTMRVLQFAFGPGGASEYHQPHAYPRRCVGYTGTHDNDTTAGWLDGLGGAIEQVYDYVGKRDRGTVLWDLLDRLQRSPASIAMVPMQDYLGLGSEARMNRPGVVFGNWRWKLRGSELTGELAGRIRALAEAQGRSPRR